MDHFSYRNLQDPGLGVGAEEPRYELCCEWVPVQRVVEAAGTPTLVYSQATIVDRFYAYAEAHAPLRPMVCWSASCANELEVLRTLLGRGAGFEVASGDDLERAWLIGASAGRVLFSGMGKQDDEIRAALDGLYSPLYSMGVLVDGKAPYYRGPAGAFIVEDRGDLDAIARLARAQRIAARVLLRRAGRGAFGFTDDQIRRAMGGDDDERRVRVVGLATQPIEARPTPEPTPQKPSDPAPADDPADLGGLLELCRSLQADGHRLDRLHLARGFDAPDRWSVDDPVRTARRIQPVRLAAEELGMEISLTAPRSLVGQSTVLLTRVLAREAGGTGADPQGDTRAQRLLVDQPLSLDGMHQASTAFVWPVEIGAAHRPGFGVPIANMPGLVPTEVVTASRPMAAGDELSGVLRTAMPPVAPGDLLAVFHDRLPDLAARHGAAGSAAGRGIARVLVSNDRARLLARRLTIADTVARDTESVDLGL